MRSQPVLSNNIKSSNLIFLSVGLGLLNNIIVPELLSSGFVFFVSLVTFLTIIGLGLLVRRGVQWVKYLLAALIIFGLIGLPKLIEVWEIYPIMGVIYIFQSILQVWAVILLFQKQKSKNIIT